MNRTKLGSWYRAPGTKTQLAIVQKVIVSHNGLIPPPTAQQAARSSALRLRVTSA